MLIKNYRDIRIMRFNFYHFYFVLRSIFYFHACHSHRSFTFPSFSSRLHPSSNFIFLPSYSRTYLRIGWYNAIPYIDQVNRESLYFLASFATLEIGPPFQKLGFLTTLLAFMGRSMGATAAVTPCATNDPNWLIDWLEGRGVYWEWVRFHC